MGKNIIINKNQIKWGNCTRYLSDKDVLNPLFQDSDYYISPETKFNGGSVDTYGTSGFLCLDMKLVGELYDYISSMNNNSKTKRNKDFDSKINEFDIGIHISPSLKCLTGRITLPKQTCKNGVRIPKDYHEFKKLVLSIHHPDNEKTPVINVGKLLRRCCYIYPNFHSEINDILIKCELCKDEVKSVQHSTTTTTTTTSSSSIPIGPKKSLPLCRETKVLFKVKDKVHDKVMEEEEEDEEEESNSTDSDSEYSYKEPIDNDSPTTRSLSKNQNASDNEYSDEEYSDSEKKLQPKKKIKLESTSPTSFIKSQLRTPPPKKTSTTTTTTTTDNSNRVQLLLKNYKIESFKDFPFLFQLIENIEIIRPQYSNVYHLNDSLYTHLMFLKAENIIPIVGNNEKGWNKSEYIFILISTSEVKEQYSICCIRSDEFIFVKPEKLLYITIDNDKCLEYRNLSICKSLSLLKF